MPKPYNHPVRTAESVAVLDLLSDGRVDFGTGRSSTRAELEGFGIDPHETRAMWQEAIEHVVGCWTNDEHEFDGKLLVDAEAARAAEAAPGTAPADLGRDVERRRPPRRSARSASACARSPSVCSPEEVKQKIDIYREAVAALRAADRQVRERPRAATFTMTLCAPTREEAHAVARESFEWYPKAGARQIATVAEWMAEQKQRARQLRLRGRHAGRRRSAPSTCSSLEYLVDAGACVLGTPDQCLETCERYEAAGVDLLLCLVNPYKIPHESVMQTIELMGRHVIPRLR